MTLRSFAPFLMGLACSLLSSATASGQSGEPLSATIARLDSLFFAAYNNCDIATQTAYFSDSVEFYHDKSGLETSKTNLLANTQRYICGKVRRELVPGSLEVSPLPGYGAVVLGQHRFHNLVEKSVSPPSKFVIIWKNTGGKWTITRVISLHA